MPEKKFLPILPFEKIAKNAGVARLSKEGAEELREIIEEKAISIAEQATRVAMHAGRKTVTRSDIEFVAGKVDVPEAKPAENKKEQPKQDTDKKTESQTAKEAAARI
jgi:histone H3/H4